MAEILSNELVGRWWLPDNPEHDESGILQIGAEGDMELSVNGALEDPARWQHDSLPATPIVWGITTNQKLVTLIGALPRGITHSVPGYVTERYSPQAALIGDHLTTDDLRFTAAQVTYDDLGPWLGQTGIQTTVGSSVRDLRISVNPPEIAPIQLASGPTVRIHFGYRWTFRGHIDETISIRYEFDQDRSLEDALTLVSEIRQLLTLQGGRSALPTRVSLFSSRRSAPHIHARESTEIQNQPLVLVRAVVQPGLPMASEPSEYLLSVPQHPTGAAGLIVGWHDTAKRFAQVVNVAAALYYDPPSYRNPELLLAASMAETLHRLSGYPQQTQREDTDRWRDLLRVTQEPHAGWLANFVNELVEPSQRRRLTDLLKSVEPLGSEMVRNIPQYALRVNRWRNAAIHHGESDGLTGAHLYQLAATTRLLVELNLMASAGYRLVEVSDWVRSTRRFRAITSLRLQWPEIN